MMRRTVVTLGFVISFIIAAGPGIAADSIGFNFARAGVPLSFMSAGEDPFVGLYVGNSGGAGYTNITTAGTYTYKGVTMVAPNYSQNYPYYGYYWANANVSSPADDLNYFKRSGAGGVGIEEPHSSGTFTLFFAGIPYGKYDAYISALNGYSGTGSLAVSNGPTFRLGATWPINWDTPVRITSTTENPSGVSTGNWMVAQGLTSSSLAITFSTAGGWKGGIGSIQFVDASAPGATLEISSINVEGSNAVVEWPGSNAWSYTVQYAPSLDPLVTWSNLSGFEQTPGVDGLMSATDVLVSAQAFYRVKMSPTVGP